MELTTAAMAQEQPSTPAAPAPAAPPPADANAPTLPHPAPPVAPPAPQTTAGAVQPVDPTAPPPPTVPEMFAQLVPILVIFGIVYIMVLRPRARKEKEEQAALRNVRRGDTIVTTSGMIGKVTRSVDDSEVEFELAPNVRIRLLRSAIAEVRSRGEPVKDAPAPAPAKSETKPEPGKGKGASRGSAKS